MKIQMLKAKLHRACVTQANIEYEGSLGIDAELLEAVGLYPYEKILVANINNGQRFETYVISVPFGSRQIIPNGAAARLASPGDRIIIMAFCWVKESLVREGKYKPRIIRLDERNEPIDPLHSNKPSEGIAAMIE